MKNSIENGINSKKNIQLNKPLVIKLILIFVLSNIFTLLFALEWTSSTIDISEQMPIKIERPDYINIKVKLEILTALNTESPYTISDQNHSIYIPNVFYEEILETNEDRFIESLDEKIVSINIHKKYLRQILQAKKLKLYPQVAKEYFFNKKPQRTHYEVNF